jgi:hypothetical protein
MSTEEKQQTTDFQIGDKVRLSKLGLLKWTGWHDASETFVVKYIDKRPPSYISVAPATPTTVHFLGVGWTPGGMGGPVNQFEKVPPKSKPTVKVGDAIRTTASRIVMVVREVKEETIIAIAQDSIAGGEYTSDEYEKVEEA